LNVFTSLCLIVILIGHHQGKSQYDDNGKMMVTIKMEQKETTVSLLIAPVLSLKQILPVSINTFLKLQFSIVAERGRTT